MELSVYYPQYVMDIQELRAFARETTKIGSARLWVGQSFATESSVALASLGLESLPAGYATMLMPTTTAIGAALTAVSVARVTGYPFRVALAPGSPQFRTSLGSPWATTVGNQDELVSKISDFLVAFRQCLGKGVQQQDRGISLLDHPGVEIGIGTLGPTMAEVAAQHADFAISYLAPPQYISDTILPYLSASTQKSVPKMRAILHVFACDDNNPYPAYLSDMSATLAKHLSATHYRRMLKRSGIDYDRPIEDLLRDLSDHKAVIVGTIEEIVVTLLEIEDLGISEVVLNPAGMIPRFGVYGALSRISAVLRLHTLQSRIDAP